ncbi:hypothetical protein HanRHA438_Chr06g0253921 [Helianthus annuus]|nr:hypothetical protein HanRHA438_Chr06g0253921 [Helianthus annuus]
MHCLLKLSLQRFYIYITREPDDLRMPLNVDSLYVFQTPSKACTERVPANSCVVTRL